MADRSHTKNLILKWFDDGHPDAGLRRRFASDIDRFFAKIAQRNDWRECITTTLEDGAQAAFRIGGPGWSARPSGKGLAVTSIVPAWNLGWRNVFKDSVSEAIFSWLGHYARQYVHRSTVAKVLMVAWERNRLVLHPFGGGTLMQRYTGATPIPTHKAMLANAWTEIGQDAPPGNTHMRVSRSAWAGRNTLDPALHQAISHFLRGQTLIKADFELEGLLAFDCVLQSLQFMDWSLTGGDPRRVRGDLCQALGLGENAADLAEEIYFLRNNFLAHAGGWRWWDAGELLDDDMVERASNLAWRALRKAADLEPGIRRVEATPTDWSVWLEENFQLIWKAVWYQLK